MPIKLRHLFQKEYGKKKGTRIFYAWENKHHPKKATLTLVGSPKYIKYMSHHLPEEHKKTRGNIFVRNVRR
jgi:hypothetical protein